MNSRLKFFIIMLNLTSTTLLASGTYRSSSRAPRTRIRRVAPTRPAVFQTQKQSNSSATQGTRFTGPTKLRDVTLLDKMNKFRKGSNISVHETKVEGENFTVEGSYTRPNQFQDFLNKMRESVINQGSLVITKKKNSFAGRRSYDFLIKGQNLWK